MDKIKNYSGDYARLGDCVILKKGIEVGTASYQAEGIPFIRVSNLSPFALSEEKYIDDNLYSELKEFQPEQGDILLSKDASPGIAYHFIETPQQMIVSGGILRLQKVTEALNHETLCLILNSLIVKEQINRDVGGSVILHWRPEQIADTLIPIVSQNLQKTIHQTFVQSYQLRAQAKKLLECAKKAVEMAIEQGETCALRFLQEVA